MWKDFLSKRTILKLDLLQSPQNILLAGVFVRLIFSPEILQAGAVMGLMAVVFLAVTSFAASMCIQKILSIQSVLTSQF